VKKAGREIGLAEFLEESRTLSEARKPDLSDLRIGVGWSLHNLSSWGKG
jgi:hypothetical protein